jgi:hypothetical protein
VLRRAHLDDLAVGHEHDPVADGAGEAHLVGDDDHRHPRLGQLDHDVEDLFDHLGVEGRGGLVEQHHLGLHGQGPGDGDPLLLATGELARILAGLLGDPTRSSISIAELLGLALGHPAHLAGRKGDVVEHGHVGEEVEGLEDHPGLPADLLDVLDVVAELDPVDDDPSGVVLLQAVDASDQGRLARAGGADDDHHLLAAHPHVDVLEGLEVAEVLVDALEPDHRLTLGTGWHRRTRCLLAHRSPTPSRFSSLRASRDIT